MTTQELVDHIKSTGKSHLVYSKTDPLYKEFDRAYRKLELQSAFNKEGYKVESFWDVLSSSFQWIVNKKQ